MIENITATIVSNTLIFGILAFLFKKIICHLLDKDIDKFKNKIETGAQKEIEHFKSALETDRLKLQISYGGIFEKQANVVLELYAKLNNLSGSIHNAIHSSERPIKRKALFREPWRDLHKYYLESRIFLPEDIDEDIKNFLNKILRTVHTFNNIDHRLGRPLSDEQFDRLAEKQDEIYEIINAHIPELNEALISKMRQVLGIKI